MQNFAIFQDGINAQSGRLSLVGQKLGMWLKKIPLIRWQQLVVVVIVIWLTHSLAQLFWLMAAAPAIPPAEVSQNAISGDSGTSAPRSVDIAALKNLNMFGVVSQTASVENVVVAAPSSGPQIEEQAVDTKLKLVLQGVINSSEAKGSRAIIAQGKSQAVYGTGDELPKLKGVKVAKILDRRVILDNKGRYESLWLYSDDPNAPKVSTSAIDVPNRSWEDSSSTEGKPKYNGPEIGRPERALRRGLEGGAAGEISLDEANKKLADVVAINIHRVKGKVIGFRLRPGRDAAAFEALGLEAGDIVTAVNGELLDGPSKIMEVYRNIGQATSASLEIERDGSPVSVDIQLD